MAAVAAGFVLATTFSFSGGFRFLTANSLDADLSPVKGDTFQCVPAIDTMDSVARLATNSSTVTFVTSFALRLICVAAIGTAFSGCSTRLHLLPKNYSVLTSLDLGGYPSDVIYLSGVAITPISPATVSGTTFSILPSLPGGLSLDASTGTISGTPTVTAAATGYTITAVHGDVTSSKVIRIRTGPGFRVNDFGDASDASLGDGICATAGGVCTLRAAIGEANALGGATNRMVLIPVGTVALSGAAEISIASKVEIIGAGQSSTTIDGGATAAPTPSQRIFTVSGAFTVIISKVTLQNTKPAGAVPGGALSVSAGANVTVSYVSFLDNHTTGFAVQDGGGAAHITGATTVFSADHCYVAGNSSGGRGGGFFITGVNAPSVITDCIFENNSAVKQGGALAYGCSSNHTLKNSLLTGNASTTNNGGAVDNDACCQNNTFSNLTVYNNTAAASGGGLYVNAGNSVNPHHVINCTVVSNHAVNNFSGVGASWPVGGNAAILTNTILYQNTRTTFGTLQNCGGAATKVLSGGGNYTESDVGTECTILNLASDFTSAGDPLLGALQDNGGSTHTMALSAGSAAIDHGLNAGCTLTDQRGSPRPANGTCDIGAFEVQ